MLTELTKDVSREQLENFFSNLAQRLGGGAPDEIKVIDAIGVAYVTFPSTFAAQKFFDVLSKFETRLNIYRQIAGSSA